MKQVLIVLVLLISNSIFAQRSTFFTYYFKLFAPDRSKEITVVDFDYDVKGSFDNNFTPKGIPFLKYGNWNHTVSKWEIIEPDHEWRKIVSIQIIKRSTKDTMTVFTDTDDKSEWNRYRLMESIDTIYFKKGRYQIINTPAKQQAKYHKQIKEVTPSEMNMFILEKLKKQ